MEIKKDWYYRIHSFMIDELNLSGGELNVYALIYSFSQDGNGAYHGSRDVMANRTGLCSKTVERILKSLEKKGLITRKKQRNLYSNYEYRVNRGPVRGVENSGQKLPCEEGKARFFQEEKALQEGTPPPVKGDAVSHNNKENTKEILTTTSSSIKYEPSEFLLKLFDDASCGWDVKYPTAYFGRHSLVCLTLAQYLKLTELVSEEILNDYIQKLDKMKNDTQNPAIFPHSDYRTISKWINQDLGL